MSDNNPLGQNGYPIIGVENGQVFIRYTDREQQYENYEAFERREVESLLLHTDYLDGADGNAGLAVETRRRLAEIKKASENGTNVSYSFDTNEIVETIRAQAQSYPYVVKNGDVLEYRTGPNVSDAFKDHTALQDFLEKKLNEGTQKELSGILDGLRKSLRNGVVEQYRIDNPKPDPKTEFEKFNSWMAVEGKVQAAADGYLKNIEPLMGKLNNVFSSWQNTHKGELNQWIENLHKGLIANPNQPFKGFEFKEFTKSDEHKSMLLVDPELEELFKPEKLEAARKRILASIATSAPVKQAVPSDQTVKIEAAPGGMHTTPVDPYDKPGNQEKYWWQDNERNVRAFLAAIPGFKGVQEDESRKGVFTASLGHLGEFIFERAEPGVRSGSVSLKTPEFKEEHAKFLVNMAFMNLPPGSRSVTLTSNPAEAAKQTYMLLLKKGFDVSVAGINPSVVNDWKAEHMAWAASHQAEAMGEQKPMRQRLSAPPPHDPGFVPKPDESASRPGRKGPAGPQGVENPLDQKLVQNAQMQQRPRVGPAPSGAP